MQIGVQDLHLGIRLDVPCLDLAGADGIDVDGLHSGAVQLGSDPLHIQHDLRHILGNPGDGGELMLYTLNLHGGRSIAGQAGQQDPTQGVAQRHAVTALQRLHDILAVGGILRRIETGNARLFNFNH